MAGPGLRVVRPPAMSAVATPTTTHGIYWRPEKNGPGSGRFSLALDDDAYALVQINDVAIITIDGTDVAAILIEMINERTLHEEGGAHTIATYNGGLVDAFLEWGVIAPALGDQAKPIEDDAIFDSSSPRYDPADDPWENATEIMSVTAAKAGGWPTQPMGQDFTDSTGAMMIWQSDGTDTDAPVGTCLFYEDVTITTAGRYVLEVLHDNDGPVRVDTVQQLDIHQNDGYHHVSFKRVDLTAETHRLWFKVRNINGPGALAYNLYKADQGDRIQPDVGVVAKSDSTTKVLSYPDPLPGMTVGEILLDLLGEAQARGCLTWLDPTFSKSVDSDGVAWDREVGITTKTGTTLIQFLDELVAAGRIAQWKIQPDGITFDVFAPGYTSGTVVTLDPAPLLDPNAGQVVSLDRKIT